MILYIPLSCHAKIWLFSEPQPWVGPVHVALSIILEAAMTQCKQDLGEEQQLLVILLLTFSGDRSRMLNHGIFTQRERLQLSHVSQISQFG